ncbi:MAG: MFS transporter [Opitutales bacterium]|nr:MFS transporter [Opitutales bacterium]
MNSSLIRFCFLMFFQFFTWGAWFTTLGLCLGSNQFGAYTAAAYGAAPLGAMIAPLFLAVIADRFFPSQVVMGFLFIVGGILLLMVPEVLGAGNGDMMITLLLGNMLCFMPTLGLANSIAFANLDRLEFPKVRVWGTIGWIASGFLVGLLGWSAKFEIFYLAGTTSLILGGFSFCLPHTPAPAKGKPVNIRDLFMLDAFSLLKRPAFFVFILCSTLICIPLAYYYGTMSYYLGNTGFVQPASTMAIGQISEIFFMLLIPFFFRKLGVKKMILIGMLAWVLRYTLFSIGAPEQVQWMIFMGIALHGICYDFFFVTGFMYTDKEAPSTIRNQAQSMLVFFTQGLGMYVGYGVCFGIFYQVPSSLFGISLDFTSWGRGVPGFGELDQSINALRDEGTNNMLEQFGQMFAVNIPAGLPSELLVSTMVEWKDYWMFPALMAVTVAAVFMLFFWDKGTDGTDSD